MYFDKINTNLESLEKNLKEFEKIYNEFILELATRIVMKDHIK